MIPLLSDILKDVPHEIIVVDDDSPDRTWEVAEHLSKRYRSVRVIRRIGRRGLSSAVVEGFDVAQGDVLAVMDSDGQHDPTLLPHMERAIQSGVHLVVASRYTFGGSTGKWGGPRLWLSKAGTFLARHLPPVSVSDPMSGYFALRRTMYRSIAPQMRPQGFKILLEVLAHLPRGTRTAEVPMTFGARWAGRSKLSLRVQGQFLSQILRIAAGRLREFFWEAQWVVLFLAAIILLILLLPRAWNVRLLAIDPAVRANAQSALRAITEKEGWMLSDISLLSVAPTSVRFLHHEHRRGEDPTQCYILRFEPLTLIPCAE